MLSTNSEHAKLQQKTKLLVEKKNISKCHILAGLTNMCVFVAEVFLFGGPRVATAQFWLPSCNLPLGDLHSHVFLLELKPMHQNH